MPCHFAVYRAYISADAAAVWTILNIRRARSDNCDVNAITSGAPSNSHL